MLPVLPKIVEEILNIPPPHVNMVSNKADARLSFSNQALSDLNKDVQ